MDSLQSPDQLAALKDFLVKNLDDRFSPPDTFCTFPEKKAEYLLAGFDVYWHSEQIAVFQSRPSPSGVERYEFDPRDPNKVAVFRLLVQRYLDRTSTQNASSNPPPPESSDEQPSMVRGQFRLLWNKVSHSVFVAMPGPDFAYQTVRVHLGDTSVKCVLGSMVCKIGTRWYYLFEAVDNPGWFDLPPLEPNIWVKPH